MRLHIWTDDEMPPVIVIDDECVQVIDYPFWKAYEIGDQIQYQTEVGTSVYFVIDVQQEHDLYEMPGTSEMRRVTVRGA